MHYMEKREGRVPQKISSEVEMQVLNQIVVEGDREVPILSEFVP